MCYKRMTFNRDLYKQEMEINKRKLEQPASGLTIIMKQMELRNFIKRKLLWPGKNFEKIIIFKEELI